MRLHNGIYESWKHYNRLSQEIVEHYETENSIYILIHEHLYRKALEFPHSNVNYLIGYDDGSSFIERVPSSVDSVQEAIEWLKPAEVKKAEQEGRTVLRQGDVFFVEMSKNSRKTIADYELPSNHTVRQTPDGICVVHHEHTTLKLPHPYFKPIQRKTIASMIKD